MYVSDRCRLLRPSIRPPNMRSLFKALFKTSLKRMKLKPRLFSSGRRTNHVAPRPFNGQGLLPLLRPTSHGLCDGINVSQFVPQLGVPPRPNILKVPCPRRSKRGPYRKLKSQGMTVDIKMRRKCSGRWWIFQVGPGGKQP